MAENQEAWKQFQGTELGALMNQLYGNQNKPKINYPKPATKHSKLPTEQFRPCGGKADAVDPRKATKRDVVVAVPTNFKNVEKENICQIDVIKSRKSSAQIKSELDDIYLKQSRYRPAYTQPISSDMEKDKLSQIFSYKGGKGLPEELTQPVSQAPFELLEKKKEMERIESIKIKRGLIKTEVRAPVLSENEQLAQQITREIEDRRHHLEEMREIGIKPAQEIKIKQEIARKIEELNRLEI